jgi:ATP-binding cassette, subfamily B, multidrug efflux pump
VAQQLEASETSSMRSLQRVLTSLGAYRWLSLGAVSSLLLLTAANAATPQLFRWGIDQGIAKKDLQVVLYGAGAMVIAAIARGLFNFGQSFWAEAASQGVAYDLRNKIFSKIQNLSFSYHDQSQTSQLLTRVTSDIEQVRTFLGTSLVQVVSSVVTLVTIAIVLLFMNWQSLHSLLYQPQDGCSLNFLQRIVTCFDKLKSSLVNLMRYCKKTWSVFE